MTKENQNNELMLFSEDYSVTELFDIVKPDTETKYLSYIPGLFTTASLPFKNVKKTVFTRKGSQGLTLTLTSPLNVPFGRYGRLLLTVLTTHAVLSKEKNVPVMIEYNSLSELLKEMQLPRQRGKDIKEQLECFTNATFAFSYKETTLKSGYLFKNLYEEGKFYLHKSIVDLQQQYNFRKLMTEFLRQDMGILKLLFPENLQVFVKNMLFLLIMEFISLFLVL